MAPSLVTSLNVNGATAASTALTTGSFTPNVGDIIVVKGVTEDSGNGFTGAPTDTQGNTYTQQVLSNAASNTWGAIWTTTATVATSMTVSSSTTATNAWRSMTVEVWTGASLAGTPAVNGTKTGSGAPSSTITTTANNSVVTWLNGDWAATSPAGVTYNTTSATPTQDGLHDKSPSQYVAYYAYQTAATAGSQTVGITSPNTQTWTLLAIEILEAAPAAEQNQFPPVPWLRWQYPWQQFRSVLEMLSDPTETAGAAPVALDDTGTAVDAVTVGTTVPLADTGTGADALTVTVTVALADTGTGADSLSVSGTIPLTDTGSGSDSVSVAATVPLSDTAAGADVLGVSASAVVDPYQASPWVPGMLTAPNMASLQFRGDTTTSLTTQISLTDTGAAVDALSVAATVPLNDTASGVDVLSVSATVPLADTGSGVDALSIAGANPSLPDTATGSDALTITATVPLADTAVGSDALTITATVPLADTGVGIDSLSVLAVGQPDPFQAGQQIAWMFARPAVAAFQLDGDSTVTAGTTPSLPDTGIGADALSVTATTPLADTAAGSDALSVTATVPLADTAAGSDALSITATVPLSEGGTAADTMSVSGSSNPSLSESGTATDSLTVTATVPLADTASGADVLAAVRVFTTTDTATGTDVVAVAATVPLAETGTAVDALAIVATRPLSDTATGVDALSVQIVVAVNLGGDAGVASEALTVFVGVTGGTITGGQRSGPGIRGGVEGSARVVGAARGGYVTGGRR